MKKIKFLAILCAACCATSMSSCSFFAKSKMLCVPAKAEELTWEEHYEENFLAFKEKTNAFSAKFASNTYAQSVKMNNFAVSPVSVFMALGMASACADGETKTELLSALGVSAQELTENYAKLYNSLHVEHKSTNAFDREKTTGTLKLSNSIWLDNSLTAKNDTLSTLANDYYCYAHEVDFDGNNKNANDAIKNFIRKQTKGLIKRNFALDEETIFTLINTLYLKDIWNMYGDELKQTSKTYTFTNSDSSTTDKRLLQGKYITGRAYETESYSAYYTTTYHGYKIKFMLPNNGYSVADIFTEENLKTFNAVADFDAEDEINLKRYHTRCFFPEYKASFNGDVKEILEQDFSLTSLFDKDNCDFTALTDDKPAYCDGVIHQTSLEVNKRGIEGAAITVIPGAGAPGPDEYENVYVDFIVDRAFGFILTDSYNTVIFAGVVENI